MARTDSNSAAPPAWRIIYDPPGSGSWNMAVDEMMLERVATHHQPMLRLYAWHEPTLSLGYFQNLDDRQSHYSSLNCPVVRRSTGGGAIVHDREITYSVALPLADRWSAQATNLYDRFHGGLVRVLRDFGVIAHLCEGTVRQLPEPFLCFNRRAKGDVLIPGENQAAHKVAGSAQRRRPGSLIQHGSVILQRSAAAPEILGLSDLADNDIAAEPLVARWIDLLIPEEGLRSLDGWSAEELEQARSIEASRFANVDWLTRRTTT